MTTSLCPACEGPPKGKEGHDGLEHQVEGPYPGHHIFKCAVCSERWIRHYGSVEDKFAWSRYNLQFTMRVPQSPRRRVPS
jgi:hypothetical protein